MGQKLELEITVELEEELQALYKRYNLELDDIFTNAISLFAWAASSIDKGYDIVAFDGKHARKVYFPAFGVIEKVRHP